MIRLSSIWLEKSKNWLRKWNRRTGWAPSKFPTLLLVPRALSYRALINRSRPKRNRQLGPAGYSNRKASQLSPAAVWSPKVSEGTASAVNRREEEERGARWITGWLLLDSPLPEELRRTWGRLLTLTVPTRVRASRESLRLSSVANIWFSTGAKVHRLFTHSFRSLFSLFYHWRSAKRNRCEIDSCVTCLGSTDAIIRGK